MKQPLLICNYAKECLNPDCPCVVPHEHSPLCDELCSYLFKGRKCIPWEGNINMPPTEKHLIVWVETFWGEYSPTYCSSLKEVREAVENCTNSRYIVTRKLELIMELKEVGRA